MQVKEILRVKGATLYTATPQQTLSSAIDTMAELDVGSLVVVDQGRMVGMVSFREILQALKSGRSQQDVLIGDIMVVDPVYAVPEMEANDLRRLMIEKRSRYLPVLRGDELLGVISFLDVAKAVLEEQSLENTLLKSYIKNWPETSAA